ncbi:MAG: type II secretion system protein GspF, partial [Oligoflexia bacterium]|nr:type II secretion system protein GspF [Oligoflexia bacterium]
MPVFIYNAIEKDGRVVSGQIKSQSLESARRALKVHKIDPISIKEKEIISFSSKRRKVKTSVILFFTRQLSFLLEAGVSLIQALEMRVN